MLKNLAMLDARQFAVHVCGQQLVHFTAVHARSPKMVSGNETDLFLVAAR